MNHFLHAILGILRRAFSFLQWGKNAQMFKLSKKPWRTTRKCEFEYNKRAVDKEIVAIVLFKYCTSKKREKETGMFDYLQVKYKSVS